MLYISGCVCSCAREKKENSKRENRDRHSANGISSPVSIKILELKNQCPYSVDYRFLKHSYTLCQLVECALARVCARCLCNESLYKLHFATCPFRSNAALCFSPTEGRTRAAVAAAHLWCSSRSIYLMSQNCFSNTLMSQNSPRKNIKQASNSFIFLYYIESY